MTDLIAIDDTFGSFVTLRQGFGEDDDAPWEIPVRVFLAKLDGANVLVDAGVGPAGGGSFMPDRQGRLVDELGRHGVSPDDVDLVVFTHLHVDHIGWAVVDGEPFFRNARYVAHADDFAYFASPEADALDLRDQLDALRRGGRAEAVDRDGEIHPGVALVHLPGHTPGHCAVELAGAFVIGDAAVDPRQVADPARWFFAEVDRALAARTRRRLFEDLADAETLVASPHFATPFGRIRRDGDGFAWTPAD